MFDNKNPRNLMMLHEKSKSPEERCKSRKIQQWIELHFRRSLIGIVFCVCHHRLPTFIPFLESVSATLALSSKVVLEVASLADLQEIRWTFLWSNFGRRYIRIVAAIIKAEDKADKLFFLYWFYLLLLAIKKRLTKVLKRISGISTIQNLPFKASL